MRPARHDRIGKRVKGRVCCPIHALESTGCVAVSGRDPPVVTIAGGFLWKAVQAGRSKPGQYFDIDQKKKGPTP
jgi:hypothetical protein